MPSRPPVAHIVVTGANGYIGSHFLRIAAAEGRAITVLGRSAPAAPGLRFARWSLGEPLPQADYPEGTALLHLAHDWRDRDTDGANARGTALLLQGARERNFRRFVFVSSVSARAEALNAYGRIKSAIEQTMLGADTVSARVGLVYGGARKGMYGLLTKLVSTLPFLPMIDPHRPVQPIHVDEVCRGLLALIDGDETGWVGLAGPDPIPFGTFLRMLAREGFASSLRILPIPAQWALLAADISARIPVGPTIDKERILGLAGTRTVECRAHLEALGITVDTVAEGLRKDVIGTRALLAEARVTCGSVLGQSPSGSLLRRYVRAVRTVDAEPGPLALPRLTHRRPSLLRFVEPFDKTAPAAERLRLATSLAEMSPDFAISSGTDRQKTRLASLVALALLLVTEAVALPFRLLARWRS